MIIAVNFPIYNCSSKWIISYTSHHFTPQGRYELNKLTSLPMCGFIAQLVEQRTGNAEVTGSNPVEVLIFFRLLLSNKLLKLKNLLRWSFFTLIYNRSSKLKKKMNYFIYFTSMIFLGQKISAVDSWFCFVCLLFTSFQSSCPNLFPL